MRKIAKSAFWSWILFLLAPLAAAQSYGASPSLVSAQRLRESLRDRFGEKHVLPNTSPAASRVDSSTAQGKTFRDPGSQFVNPTIYYPGEDISDAAVADFNGDGRPDIAVLKNSGTNVTLGILLNARS